MEINAIIEAYNNGESMNSIANTYNTHPTTIRRLLIKNNVPLRHDVKLKRRFLRKRWRKTFRMG